MVCSLQTLMFALLIYIWAENMIYYLNISGFLPRHSHRGYRQINGIVLRKKRNKARKRQSAQKSKTLSSLAIGSTVSSHATVCDPVCLPELLSWKRVGVTSIQEVEGILELRGDKAEWLMIHRFKHHRMAPGKPGATREYIHTVASANFIMCFLVQSLSG